MTQPLRFTTLALLASLALPLRAEADWLEVYPTCAMGEAPRRSGPAELLYPRPGLAAFARPGEPLVMRVRVPAPLTPPPGVQQERALAGWYFELVGSDAEPIEGARHHYRLRVADVRPDGHSTLVYRTTVQLPPWLAPGTYDVRLRSPGSDEVRAPASLRVGMPGEAPVIGRLVRLPDAETARALARLSVDVWVVESEAESEAEAGVALPWLDRSATFAVRVGDQLLVAGGCDDPHVPFAVATDRAGGRPFQLPPLPGAGRFSDAQADHPLPTGSLERVGDHWINRTGHPLRVTLVFPEGERGVSLDGASRRIGFWPGTPVRPVGHRASVVGLWLVAPGARLRARRLDPDPPSLDVRIGTGPTTHAPTPVRVRSSGRVALAWEEDGSAFVDQAGDRSIPLRFRWLEHHEVHALAIGPRGAARRLATATVVETERPSGCSATGRAPGAALLALGLLLVRRRRPRVG